MSSPRSRTAAQIAYSLAQDSLPKSIEAARQAGLRYQTADRPGIQRIRSGKSFRYVNARGRPIRDEKTLARIRSLAIPPAHRDVWISPDPRGHLQAVGFDARGRKQYRYHPRWSEARGRAKFDRLVEFARVLPRIRETTCAHLRRRNLSREKVLATVVQLLERTLIRVGNEEYVKTNHSYGLSTLKNHHVQIERTRVRFHFKGKSGIQHAIELRDPRLAAIIHECRHLPGEELFQYVDDDGASHSIRSQDVNEYLKSVSGADFTAKDFRTWAGTVLAAQTLREAAGFRTHTEAKRRLNKAVSLVSQRLGNTRAICRKSYIHPAVIETFLAGGSVLKSKAAVPNYRDFSHPMELSREEKNVLAFLRKRTR